MKRQENIRKLAASFEAMREEQSRAARLIPNAFPVGSEVYWEHGGRLRYAKVVEHAQHDHLRVKVRGATGKEYWVGVWNFLRAMVEGFEG